MLEKFKDYFLLTKPRVIELLLVATIPVMLLAERGSVPIVLILNTFFAGWLGAASANSMNMVIDADIDMQMDRTKDRPIPAGRITRKQGLIFSSLIGIISIAWFVLFVNWLAAGLVLFTILFYVFVYTLWLKRKTSQNIIWGGIAGCMPVLIGWVAVRNKIEWPAIILFLVIFFWTPPHTWALAIKYKADYQKVSVPMLPVVKGQAEVVKQIFIFTVATVLSAWLLIPYLGWIYLVATLLAGVWFIYMSYKLKQELAANGQKKALAFFLKTNAYLAVIFSAIAVDSLLGLNLLA